MLLHRLPLDQPEHCGRSSGLESYGISNVPRLSLRPWFATILSLDLAAAAALPMAIDALSASPMRHDAWRVLAAVAASIAVWLLAAHQQRLYDGSRILSGRGTLLPALATAVTSFSLMLLPIFAAAPEVGAAGLQLLLAGAAIASVLVSRMVWQACLRAALRRGRCLDRPLVLAGSAAAARGVAASIEDASNGAIRVAASVPLPGIYGGPSFAWIEDAVREKQVDRVLIADFEHVSAACSAIMPWLMRLAVDVALVPDSRALRAPHSRVSRIGFVPAAGVVRRPPGRAAAAAKRIEDVAVALTALLLTAPALLAISVAVKLDSPGPVLFRQPRVGLNGTLFRMWKFRTMYADMTDAAAAQQTCRNDPRVTRIGRLLRRSSLDELPQLLNVLRGEMSIVGPRPHAVGMTVAGLPLPELMEGYEARHRVKPGITGWAQVNGSRGPIETEQQLRQRVELDCHYIETRSLGMDAWIMFRTAALLAFDRHAF